MSRIPPALQRGGGLRRRRTSTPALRTSASARSPGTATSIAVRKGDCGDDVGDYCAQRQPEGREPEAADVAVAPRHVALPVTAAVDVRRRCRSAQDADALRDPDRVGRTVIAAPRTSSAPPAATTSAHRRSRLRRPPEREPAAVADPHPAERHEVLIRDEPHPNRAPHRPAAPRHRLRRSMIDGARRDADAGSAAAAGASSSSMRAINGARIGGVSPTSPTRVNCPAAASGPVSRAPCRCAGPGDRAR